MKKENKVIITIGRQLGSGGRIIGTRIANDFGMAFYDRELLDLAAQESGFAKELFKQNDERHGFFRHIFHQHSPHVTDSNFYSNKVSQESLFQFQSDAIRRAAEESSCVIVGRCADYILRDVPGLIRIFITADISDRVERVMERRNCTENDARHFIAAKEGRRAENYNYYTGKKWGDSNSYDLCVNSSILGIDATVALIESYIGSVLKKREDDRRAVETGIGTISPEFQ